MKVPNPRQPCMFAQWYRKSQLCKIISNTLLQNTSDLSLQMAHNVSACHRADHSMVSAISFVSPQISLLTEANSTAKTIWPLMELKHADVSTSACKPLHKSPGGQEQLKLFTRSWHVAPFWHGFGWQSSTFSSQFCPWKPLVHWHEYEPIRSLHVAPFWHGADSHSLISSWQ